MLQESFLKSSFSKKQALIYIVKGHKLQLNKKLNIAQFEKSKRKLINVDVKGVLD